jgi:hypothetical protein
LSFFFPSPILLSPPLPLPLSPPTPLPRLSLPLLTSLQAEQRKERGRDVYLKTPEKATKFVDERESISLSPVKYGMDAEHAIRVLVPSPSSFYSSSLLLPPSPYSLPPPHFSPLPKPLSSSPPYPTQMEEKYDYELEERIMDWIEDVTGVAMDSFYDNLRNGQVIF